ncbi:ARL14 effector protein [Frankliniella fusca]|uniref:ARL14 effector protein n=1 Tax=Frankliniella fusca TaxID=407009 RepID=A0AAE1L9Q3_9NEOP|nr:ARL14 effector protein [Frankliniella fusca]
MDPTSYKGLCSFLADGSCSGEVKPCSSLLTSDGARLVEIRSGVKAKSLCTKHFEKWFQFYELRQTHCCDPYSSHKSRTAAVKTNVVSLHMHLQSREVPDMKVLLPGQKMCKRCAQKVEPLLAAVTIQQSPQSSAPSSQSLSQGPSDLTNLFIQAAGGLENVISGPGSVSAQPLAEPSTTPSTSQDLFQDSSVEEVLADVSAGTSDCGPNDPGDSNWGGPPDRDVFTGETLKDRTFSSETTTSTKEDPNDPTFVPDAFSTLNAALTVLNVEKVDKRKLTNEVLYGTEKIRKINEKFENLITEAGGVVHPPFNEEFYSKTLSALKSKFQASKNNSDKVGVLSIALVSMSQRKVLEEFQSVGATEHIIRKTAALMEEQDGILPTPNLKKASRFLPSSDVDLIKNFYELDDISSRAMPGMKDYVSVREGGVKVHKQKRLILTTLTELFQLFRKEHPEVQVKFVKFASLRPKHCVLAGGSGTHSVCVCKYHQNFKLLLEGANFKKYDQELNTYYDFLGACICNPPRAECYIESCCPTCPGADSLEIKLKKLLEDNFVDKVLYQQWTSTDRCCLETISKNADEFIDVIIEQLKTLLPHHFISKEQSKHYKYLKENLKEGEVLTVCDFAENYTCVVQDAIQSYYWKNEQVTIHPFVAYYKNSSGETVSTSFAVVSDYMKHHVDAVYAFQKEFINFIKLKVPNVKKVIYFSDGAAQQYKSKFNALNLSYHSEDFALQAEWHYFGTSHGKGPCDGLAGTMKRNAYLDSLRKQLIRSPLEFFEWAQKKMTGITVAYVRTEQVQEISSFLQNRFSKVLKVPKIRSHHCIVPVSKGEILTKHYSSANAFQYVPVEAIRKLPSHDQLSEAKYVAVLDENNWLLAEVQLYDNDTQEVLVNLMYKETSTSTWMQSEYEEVNPYTIEEVLAIVNPTVRDGIHYLDKDDITKIMWQFNAAKGLVQRIHH